MAAFQVTVAADHRPAGSLPWLQKGSAALVGVMGGGWPPITMLLFPSLPAQGTGRKKISCKFDARNDILI